MTNWKFFIEELGDVKCIKEAIKEAFQDWGNDIPATILFSIIGKKIASEFSQIEKSEATFIFEKIEVGMTEENDEIFKSYLSTGLLQALYIRATTVNNNWEKIQKSIGAKSNLYLTQWAKLF